MFPNFERGGETVTGTDRENNECAGGHGESGSRETSLALRELESAILDACAKQSEWPAQVAAGVCAGVDFAVANPGVALEISAEFAGKNEPMGRRERMIGRLAGFIQKRAPAASRLPGSTNEALVAGMVGLVGDHLRIGRQERLEELRPEFVLLTLLPYLSFSEAQKWADQVAE